MTTHYISQHLQPIKWLGLLLIFVSTHIQAQPSNILVSIKPLHSLVSHITDGVNPTQLLLTQQQSPHNFQLRPSQKRMINRADIFFYSSDHIESFVPALKQTTKQLQFIQLSLIADIKPLPVRHFHSADHGSHRADEIDGHIWLSIDNAKSIAQHVTNVLSKNAPQHTAKYAHNLAILLLKLEQLKQDNSRLLNNIKTSPYLVYHDAYQYFENENQLTGAHFVTTNPEHSPGIKRVKALRLLIKSENIRCVFYEPPNIPSLLNTLIENRAVKLSAIDPAGSQIPMGKPHYFQLLQQTATTLSTCLSQQ